MSLGDSLLQQAKRYQPYLAAIEALCIVIGVALAVMQLRAANHQAKIANTLAFLSSMQTAEFHTDYHDGILWLARFGQDKNSEAQTLSEDMGRKLEYVLDRYQNLWVLYDENILERQTIEATVGVQIAQFWLLTRKALNEDQRRGYESLDLFQRTLEQSRAVKSSKTYNKLKETRR